MSNPQNPGGYGPPGGHGPPGPYPAEQQGYPQQPGYPQQQAHPGQPGAPQPAKKGGKGLLIAILVLVPILGLGGWLGYQHFENWGYLSSPSNVQAKVDPTVEAMRAAVEDVAAACAAKSFDDNPLEDSKLLELKGLAAVRAECGDDLEEVFPRIGDLDDEIGQGYEGFEVNIRDNDGFACMAPNFFGIDDHEKTDCVMWRGSRVHYFIERGSGKSKGRVVIELD